MVGDERYSPKWGASWNPRKSQGSCFWKLALLYSTSYDVLWCWSVVFDGVCWILLCFFFKIFGWAEVSFVGCIVDIAMSYVILFCLKITKRMQIYICIHISICIYVDVYVYALYRLIYLWILRLSVEAAVEDMVGQLQLATCIFKPEDRWCVFLLKMLGLWDVILLMEEILHQLIGSLSHYLQGFVHPRWCRISSINSSYGYSPSFF